MRPSPDRKSVLVLSGFSYGLRVTDTIIDNVVDVLKKNGMSANDIFVEELDLLRGDSPARRTALVSLLQERLAKTSVGLVIVVNQPALEFLAQEGHELAPGAPVVSFVQMPDVVWNGTPRSVVNITSRVAVADTLKIGLALFPGTRRLVIVGGADDRYAPFHAQVADVLAATKSTLVVENTSTLTHDAMLQRISSLPPDSLILMGGYFGDRTGRSYIPAEVAGEIAKRANAPALGLYDSFIQEGLLGGSVVSSAAVGHRAGEIAFELLTGKRTPEAAVTDAALAPQLLFDWSQLERWGADPARLPDDTVFLHRPRTLWSEYRNAVVSLAVAVLVLLALVAALTVQNRRRLRAERDAREAQAGLEAMLNALPDLLFKLDQNGRIEEFHSSAVEQLYAAPSDFIGKAMRDVLPAPAAGVVMDALKVAARTGVCRGSIYSLRLAGEERWFELSIARMSAAERHPNHFVTLVRDVTDRKRAEAATREKEEADSANRAKGAFLANMSHEIRTPLNAIVGLSHLVRNSGLPPEQDKRLDKLESAADHLLSILNAILDLAKIDAGKLELEERPLRVESVVADVLSIMDDRVHAKGLRLISDVDRMPRDFVGDPTRLAQALLNYANNAVKFTETGSVTLRARVIEQDASSTLMRFEVEDTGIGIDSNVLPRLFSAFEQADSSTTRTSGGTGLGLAITMKLAKLMGGDAGASSVPGRGSTFWFTARLKRVDGTSSSSEASMTQAVAASILQRKHAGSKILVVEDNEINREVARDILQRAGLIVDLAEDGLDAVAMVSENDYRLVLMDMQMPKMDGLEATREIRKTRPANTLPIIAMTANAFSEDKARCVAAGMDGFLSKPVVPKVLYEVILGWLEKSAVTATD